MPTILFIIVKQQYFVQRCMSFMEVNFISNRSWCMQKATLHCFDPVKNEWQVKATTCHPHFGSSLIVVNSRLYVAGGYVSIDTNCIVTQPLWKCMMRKKTLGLLLNKKHIPQTVLVRWKIEGRVYFIINKFPTDSGIRIPPEEPYPVHLGEWENISQIDKNAALCYLPVKREILKTE
ncbi:hypothetical protein OS493_021146 [Desmophyllum pertusum]|uniref:Uncharacterized protein n=1 Tax=Desmophyllum pertusum TaxID=174260 RepID=A0A9W9ZMQ8_9CNID|nr:hypothetical protein OS493_021146 [Desmophyllum pertusum]